MTIQLNNITIQSTDNLVLTYGVMTNPNPLQIDTTGSISIVVSKSAPPAAQCTSLTFSINTGIAAADLTAEPSTISASPPPNWGVSSDGNGNFTFTPNPGQGEIGLAGLSFVLSNIAVNNQVGGTPFTIQEQVTVSGQAQTNSASCTLSKFPQNFALEYFTISPPSVPPGGNVNVSWSGSSGSFYGYSLNYGATTINNLPNEDNYSVPNLEATTVFTLTVTAGGNTQLQLQAIATVEEPEIGQFGIVGNPEQVAINSQFQLYWQTVSADHCILSMNGAPIELDLPANSQGYAVTAPSNPGNYSYSLTAVGSGGSGPSRSLVIPVCFPPAQFLSFGIVGNPLQVAQGSTIKFYWSTQNADHCDLLLNGNVVASNLPANVDASQGQPFVVPATPGTVSFTLSASYKQTNIGVSNLLLVLISSSFVLALPQSGNNIGFSPDGSQIVTSSFDIDLISTAKYQVVKTIQSRMNLGVVNATFDSTGTQIYCAAWDASLFGNTYDYYVDSYDVSSGNRLLRSPFTNAVGIVKGSASDSPLVALTGDGSRTRISAVGVLDPSTLNWVHSAQFPTPNPTLSSFAANPQGDLIILCMRGGLSYSYQPQTNTLLPLPRPRVMPTPAMIAAFHSDGRHWLCADMSDPTIQVIDSAQNQWVGQITLPASVNHYWAQGSPWDNFLLSILTVAPDGVNCFAILQDKTIAWFRFDQMKFISTVPGPTTPVALAVDPTSQYLYVIDKGSGFLGFDYVLWKIPVSTL
nr:MAG: WD40 repeat domain-containing protein [Leptolyngbya sp. IPPAS B-1204]